MRAWEVERVASEAASVVEQAAARVGSAEECRAERA
jgi:hypothetical protein